MRCIKTGNCQMYARFSRVSELTPWLDRYCLGEPERCTRLHLSRAGEVVPLDLLPDGTDLVPTQIARMEPAGG